MDSLASMFGAIFYFVGGAAGMGAVAASAAATRAVSQSSRLGNLKASRYTVETKWRGSPVQQKLLDSLDARIANAQTRADEIAASGASLGTFGAATYFIGGTFGIVGLGYDPETDGQIIGGDLEPALRSLFQQGRDYLESVGRMAAGHAVDGTDYNLLPGQRGGAEYWEENAIAYFYNDGRMLLSEADTTFNDTIKDAFSSFKPRVVDMAMTKSNFHVLAEPGYESEEQCTSLGSFGTRYIDGLCTNLWQWYPDGTGCPEGSPDRCQYIVMSETQHKALTDKYGYDIYTYMKSQIDCAKSGGTPGKADFDNLLEDGATPLCWFGVEAHKGTWAWSGIADTPGDQSFETEDW
ncbi:hypothetical protein LTR09_007580 [Extremus antarcticus]|uniref:Uncharacterized protein n=1 Tax=Extremus antarcticus TaxID=702011 RepID=A0AAJ0DJM1_9PEZI|nr:hypothetical protein LTR09_007580 [Extremus antarcticus]